MYETLLPILTLLLGQLLGYWFAVSQTRRRIAAEKRAECVSRFIAEAYQNLEYFTTPARAGEGLEVIADFSVLGSQAAFFLSDRTAAAVDDLTGHFAKSLLDRAAPHPGNPPDAWQAYRLELDKVRDLLRRELQATV